jgi:protocatechuate 3,4-dioxygenase beta subunit
LKRTLTGIAAVTLALGTFAAPMTAAAATKYNTTKVAHEYVTKLQTISVNKTESFTVTIKDSHNKAISNALVYFTSYDKGIATVSASQVVTNKNGQATVVITGHKAGSTWLKVTVNGLSHWYKVTVTAPAAATVNMTGLTDGQVVHLANQTVTVTSNYQKSVKLYLNGVRQSGNGPTFKLTLKEGKNTITAVASNGVNEVKKSIYVTFDNVSFMGMGIEGIVTDGANPVSGATVKVGSHTVTTDSNGYYRIPADPGVDTVTVSKSGYFTSTSTVNVLRNHSSANNVQLTAFDQKQLHLTGTVIDSVTGDVVQGAIVDLQALQNGKWTTIAEATTDSNGTYGFYNSGNTVTADGAHVYFATPFGNQDLLAPNTQYQLVVSKPFSSTNTKGAYATSTVTVTTSASSYGTAKGVTLRPIKAMDLTTNVTWSSKTNAADGTTATVELLAADGKTVLDSITSNGSKAVNGVEQDSVTIKGDTIPSGNYFLRVKDGTNAVEIVPITVTEGNNLTASVTINKGQELNATGTYKTTNADASSTTADITVYKTINGVDVEVDSATGVSATKSTNGSVYQYVNDFKDLDTGTYKVVVTGTYIIGTPSAVATVKDGVSNVQDVQLTAGGALDPTITLDKVANGQAVPVTVKVLDSSNKVVATATVEYDNASGSDQTNVSVTGFDFKGAIPDGTYTVEVSAPNYDTATTNNVVITDFNSTPLTATLTAKPGITVSGYVRYADDLSAVSSGTISVYDAQGHFVEKADVSGGKYSFSDLKAGTYTFVARGSFDTVAQKVTVGTGTNAVNFTVAPNTGQGKVYLTLVDSNGYPITSGTVKIYDQYYDPSSASDPGYETLTLGSGALGNDGVWVSNADLSAGTYTVSVDAGTGYKTATQKVTVSTNGSTYQRITVPLASSGATFSVYGTITDASGSTGTAKLVVLDKAGNVVQVKDVDITGGSATYGILLANGTYTIEVLFNGDLVDSRSITVQDLPEEVDFLALQATR